MPERGVVTSFFSFSTPGAAWLLAPGVLLFTDPRLFEYIGSLGTYVGTLFGIYLLTRLFFGRTPALLAIVLYGFSEHGLLAGSTVWQRYPIHCFTVWTVYCIARWVRDDSGRFLAAAILTWSVGMYVFLEMAPVIFVIPVLWLLYRPPIRILPIVAALVLAVLVWSPYLFFELGRGFADVKSQVLRQRIYHGDSSDSWCDPRAMPDSWRRDVAREVASISRTAEPVWISARRWASERVGLTVGELLLANFTSRIPGGRVVLFALTILGLAAAAVRARGHAGAGADHRRAVRIRRILWLSAGTAVLALVTNEFVLARFLTTDGALSPASVHLIRATELALLIVATVLIVARSPLSTALDRATSEWASSAPTRSTTLMAVAVGVPWLLLFLVADAERRYLWIWPLQVCLLASAVMVVPRRLGAPRWVAPLGAAVLTSLVMANTVFLSRLADWKQHGWAGQDAVEVEVTDRLAARMKSAGTRRAAIGYEIEIWRFMAESNITDQRYKAGADFDLLLRARHGLENLDQCAEGVSSDDTYRVAQTEARDTNPLSRNRVDAARPVDFKLVDRVRMYEILQRD